MAIKVGGTTVIDDSRALNNITSVDAATVTALGAAGVGGGGTADFVASGAISTGQVISLNSDGTVTVADATASGSGVNVGGTANTTVKRPVTAVYDSNSNKVVVLFNNDSDNTYLTAVVGTVSNLSISFGSTVRIVTEIGKTFDAVFDSNSNKIVAVYTQNSNARGKAIVGTVSGTTISFGGTSEFDTGDPDYVSAAFDSNSNKVVVGFYASDSSLGTRVGTVSGTTISWGSLVSVSNQRPENMSMTFDSNANKVVYGYINGGAGNVGTAIVGTVSGTTISHGTPVVFNSSNSGVIKMAFDSTANKVVFGFLDTGNSNAISAIVGTVSGTAISFGSKTSVYSPSSGNQDYTLSYNVAQGKILFVYRASGAEPYARASIGTVSGTSISFDSYKEITASPSTQLRNFGIAYDSSQEKNIIVAKNDSDGDKGIAIPYNIGNGSKVIGVAAENISNSASGKVTIIGGVNESLTGLTVGGVYYLDSTTAGLASTVTESGVKIGRAIAANKLLVTEAGV